MVRPAGTAHEVLAEAGAVSGRRQHGVPGASGGVDPFVLEAGWPRVGQGRARKVI